MRVFYIKINENDESGMNAISLVEMPAVQKDFLCFNKDEKPVQMKFDDAKHIISGVVALAGTPIYRYSPDMGEYWVVFTKETIEKMVEKYSKNGLWNSVNLQHDDNSFVNNVYMLESYIINRDRGINPSEFEDVPDGSWIASFKIEDEDLWDEIINGDKLNGFSLQGAFTLVEGQFEGQFKDENNKATETFDEWVAKQLN